jgi:hypothetical protein
MKDQTAKHEHKHSVFGLFHDEVALAHAVDALVDSGFAATDISALLPDRASTQAFAHEKHTKAPEGAVVGGATGAIAGGTLGVLVGIGAIVIPGLGAMIAAGPIVAALAGLGAGGAVGSLTGALVGMGIPEYEAKRYESFVHAGGALLSVHCGDKEDAHRARVLLDGFGATDISDRREASVPSRDRPERGR